MTNEKQPDDVVSANLETREKKPYSKPVLDKLGTLRQMTRMKHTGPRADGGGKSSYNKTGRGGSNTHRGFLPEIGE
jgi:hypothetical protein